MFTGIVETIGSVTSVAGNTIGITAEKFSRHIQIGGSVSVSGACLTITSIACKEFTVDVVEETQRRTNLADLNLNDNVNLELPVPVTGAFDGHIVQGHIDGIASVVSIIKESNSALLKFKVSASISKYLIQKGFIAVDGVSLTIVDCDADWFSIALIPHTSQNTTLGVLNEGDTVNIEVDLFAKYAEKLLNS